MDYVVPTLEEVLTPEEIEDLKTFRPSDADVPRLKVPVSIKTIEQIKAEYEEKSRYILNIHKDWPSVSIEEIDMDEFVQWIFERDVDGKKDVQPFEAIQSDEYKQWLSQIKDGVEECDYRGYSCWRYNPIVFYRQDGENRHRLLLKDDEDTMRFLRNRQFALMPPCTFVGRQNNYENARYLYAIGIDLDGVGTRQIRKLFWMMTDDFLPMANIITNSGHGLHLYYLLESPVPMYRENLPILNKLKHGMINIIWNDRTSVDTYNQYNGVIQGFRLPGTLNKFGEVIRCFHVIDSPMWTLKGLSDHLQSYRLTDEELFQLTKAPCYNPSGVTLEEAQRQWPEWYVAKVLNHKRVCRKWHVNRAVYDWWLNKLRNAGEEIKLHHRYWCILTLVIYGVKCDIPRDEVLEDAYSLVPKMDTYTECEDNHFTKEDVDDAMRAYDANYSKWPIKTIEYTTHIHIDRNRRNLVRGGYGTRRGREQGDHLRRARAVQVIDDPNGDWRKGNGRKPEAEKVREWREEHPESNNKSLCARETRLDRKTVAKWWNGEANVVQKPIGKPTGMGAAVNEEYFANRSVADSVMRNTEGYDKLTEEKKESVLTDLTDLVDFSEVDTDEVMKILGIPEYVRPMMKDSFRQAISTPEFWENFKRQTAGQQPMESIPEEIKEKLLKIFERRSESI